MNSDSLVSGMSVLNWVSRIWVTMNDVSMMSSKKNGAINMETRKDGLASTEIIPLKDLMSLLIESSQVLRKYRKSILERKSSLFDMVEQGRLF
jgi:hypothetical protein